MHIRIWARHFQEQRAHQMSLLPAGRTVQLYFLISYGDYFAFINGYDLTRVLLCQLLIMLC